MSTELVERLRSMCLALPGAEEVETWGHPTFRVRGKMFAACGDGMGDLAMSVKATPAVQDALVRGNADCFVPPYVGRYGWVGIRLHQATSWELVAGLLADAHAATAGRGKRRAGGKPPAP